MSSTSNNTLSAQPATIPVTGQTVQPSPTVAATATIPATPTPAEPVELTVLYAGSLIIPFKAIETAFEAEYPQVDVLMEGHGSIQVIRHITELGELVDVAALADYALVPKMMYQANDPESGMPYANWTIQFASNKMVLAYTPESQFSDEIDQDNWRQILADERVIKGFSDPRFDACGYRALMVLQLAEYLTGQQTVFENILMGKFKTPIITVEEDSHTVIKVPEILQTKANSDIIIRSYSVQLIALLESGDVDYAFLYETVAKQHNLEYLELPPAINLGENDQSDQYQKVSVLLDFQRFASVPPHFTGEVIAYGLTIPSNTPHQEWAETFIEFLLSPQGRSVMEANGHPLLDQYTVDSPGNLPSKLVELVEIEDGR
ncbi:MAG: tungstate ABC transporter substrate-binding protein WtpA [Anaerolineales bacterium]|nr:tungstate ABC transporter substrate-binding protein WtpA [Anaerolineales bacterium]